MSHLTRICVPGETAAGLRALAFGEGFWGEIWTDGRPWFEMPRAWVGRIPCERNSPFILELQPKMERYALLSSDVDMRLGSMPPIYVGEPDAENIRRMTQELREVADVEAMLPPDLTQNRFWLAWGLAKTFRAFERDFVAAAMLAKGAG